MEVMLGDKTGEGKEDKTGRGEGGKGQIEERGKTRRGVER